MKQLKIKHLAPYLPYGLKIKVIDTNFYKYDVMTLCDKSGLSNIGLSDLLDEPQDFKPILRPLSDLTKEIEVNGEKFVPRKEFEMMYLGNTIEYQLFFSNFDKKYITSLNFNCVQKILSWHFDIFGLIDAELAIDINTLNK
jgi:hypothetical protein